MRVLGGLVVVVVLLVRTHCEVRARDPGEEGETGGESGGAGGGWEQQEVLDDLLDGPPGPGSPRPPENTSTRTGNWCAFVQQRLVTSVVKCGTERYTIRAPCPAETPDCQLVMFQASSRPVYRQKQQVFTALQWRCCPGHSGPYCQDSDEQNDTQLPDPQFQPGNRDYGQPQPPHSNHGGSQEAPQPALHSGADQLVRAVAEQVLAQLNPVLEGFNHSLALLDRRVEELARDLAQWNPGAQGVEVQAAKGPSEDRLEEMLEKVEEVHQLLDSQRTALEVRLHSQHAMLHYNLTSFKTEVDVKIKRTWKMMQSNFQGLNASLVDLRSHQEQKAEPSCNPLQCNPAPEPAWLKHLNTTTINNLVKVSALEEDLKENSQLLGDLRRTLHWLEERISQTGRDSQVQFMETGLEVEAAREVVLDRLKELEGNISLVVQQMQHRDADVDFLFTVVYNCTALRDKVAHLERGMANQTELISENRPALEMGGQWAGHGEWEPLVKELQLSLQQVKDSLAAEHSGGLKEEMRRLSSSFDSLLKDAIRHNNILEILLGEDVLVFHQWTPLEQEAHSIPTLKERISSLQEEMVRHNHSLAMLQRDKAESPMADQPLSTAGGLRRRSHTARREQQLLVASETADGGEGALKKVVEELGLRVQALEEHGRGVQEEKLQEEVLWLRTAMQDHLRVFKKVFSQAETLEDSHRTLDLQDLWTMTQDSRRERKRGGERRRGGKDGERRRGDTDGEMDGGVRSRRDSTASSLPHSQSSPLLFATQRSGLRREGGCLALRASLNVGGVYSERTGRFTAPQTGDYLLLLTLDIRPGHAHLLLRRGSGNTQRLLQKEVNEDTGALSFLRLLHLEEEEQLCVELREGGLLESSSNALTVMLLH